MHIYAFGSVCRGEADAGSDIDLLACVDEPQQQLDPRTYSIYSYDRIIELWREGNPFAWHLYLESRLIFASDGKNFLETLGRPQPYTKGNEDCEKFRRLFTESCGSIENSNNSKVFHLSCMFLAARNFATCFSLRLGVPVFSRLSPLRIDPRLPLSEEVFDIFVRARILSTRGYGDELDAHQIDIAQRAAPVILGWMDAVDL